MDVASKIILSGHAGFPLRHTWLKKASQFDEKAFGEDSATIKLGVGKNMVQSIRYYAQHCGIYCATASSAQSFEVNISDLLGSGDRPGLDPYLDHDLSTWLIHASLASNPSLISYYSFFNLFNDTVFSSEVFVDFVGKHISSDHRQSVSSPETLKRDVGCFIANYSVRAHKSPSDGFDALLKELSLIKLTKRDFYKRVYKTNADINDSLFLYVLGQFWRQKYHSARSLSLNAVCHDSCSPGKILQMHESEIYNKFDTLEKTSRIPIEIKESAGLVNITLTKDVDSFVKASTKMLKKELSSR